MRVGSDPADIVDLSGLRCPFLVRRVRKALARAEVGESLQFVCTDPLAAIDIPHLLANLGDDLVSVTTRSEGTLFVVRRSARPSDA